MDVDWYDDELPEVRPTLVESWECNKNLLKLAGKFISVPTGLFALACLTNYWINKKMGPL